MKDKDDKIAQVLNMRPLEEAAEEQQEALDRLNPENELLRIIPDF